MTDQTFVEHCEYCGEPFQVVYSLEKCHKQRWCSAKCEVHAYLNIVEDRHHEPNGD